MDIIREIIYNDGKEKWQSYEYTIEVTENAPWYYDNFSITGYGSNVKEAKEECLQQLKEFLNNMMEFVNKIEKGDN